MVDPTIIALVLKTYGPVAGPLVLGGLILYEARYGNVKQKLDRIETKQDDQEQTMEALCTLSLANSQANKYVDHERARQYLEKNGVETSDLLRVDPEDLADTPQEVQ